MHAVVSLDTAVMKLAARRWVVGGGPGGGGGSLGTPQWCGRKAGCARLTDCDIAFIVII